MQHKSVEFMNELKNTMNSIKTLLENHQIPKQYPEFISELTCPLDEDGGLLYDRYDFISISAFPLITTEFIEKLAKAIGSSPVLEVMSGTGMLAKGLRDVGVNIIATDIGHPGPNGEYWYMEFNNPWTDIKHIDAVEAVKKYGAEVDYIIMSWPPYADYIATNVLLTMREVNPNCKMIYIGEGKGGCTGDFTFFDAIGTSLYDIYVLDEYESFREANESLRSWWGINDELFIFK